MFEFEDEYNNYGYGYDPEYLKDVIIDPNIGFGGMRYGGLPKPSTGDAIKEAAINYGKKSIAEALGSGGASSGVLYSPSGEAVATAVPEGFYGSSPFSIEGIGGAGNAFLPAAGAYGLYNLGENWGDISHGRGALQGAASGAAIGSYFGPAGALVGGGIGALGGLASSFANSGRNPSHDKRSDFRQILKDQGFIDPEGNLVTASGNLFDIGEEGKVGGRHLYEIDPNNESLGKVVGLTNPIMAVLSGGDPMLKSQFAAYLANAASSDTGGDYAKAVGNVDQFLNTAGITKEGLLQGLADLTNAGKLTQDEYAAYVNSDLLRDSYYK